MWGRRASCLMFGTGGVWRWRLFKRGRKSKEVDIRWWRIGSGNQRAKTTAEGSAPALPEQPAVKEGARPRRLRRILREYAAV